MSLLSFLEILEFIRSSNQSNFGWLFSSARKMRSWTLKTPMVPAAARAFLTRFENEMADICVQHTRGHDAWHIYITRLLQQTFGTVLHNWRVGLDWRWPTKAQCKMQKYKHYKGDIFLWGNSINHLSHVFLLKIPPPVTTTDSHNCDTSGTCWLWQCCHHWNIGSCQGLPPRSSWTTWSFPTAGVTA